MDARTDDRRYWTAKILERGGEARAFEWCGLAASGPEAEGLAREAAATAWTAATAAVGRAGSPMPAGLLGRAQLGDFNPAQSGAHATDEMWTLGRPFARAVDALGTGRAAYECDAGATFRGLVEADPFIRADADSRARIHAWIALNMQGVKNADHLRFGLIRKERIHDGCALSGRATNRAALALLAACWATGERGLYRIAHECDVVPTPSATARAAWATGAGAERRIALAAPAIAYLRAVGLDAIADDLARQADLGLAYRFR